MCGTGLAIHGLNPHRSPPTMKRKFLLLSQFLTASTFGAGALLLAACAGKVVDVPGGGSPPPLEGVSLSEINTPIVACAGGYAHPNVCCEAGPGKAASCGVYPGAPFQPCDPSSTTYPDPRSCCPIDGSSNCVAPSPTPDPLPSPSCGYTCPPGQYQPEGSLAGTCCFTDGDLIACSGSSGSGGGSGGGGAGFVDGGVGVVTVDAGVSFAVDASVGVDIAVDGGCAVTCACPACPEGEACPLCECPDLPPCTPTPAPVPPIACGCPACIEGEVCPPCDCGTPPPPVNPPPICNACPSGWQVPAGEPYLCCNEGASGVIACFSQGVPPSPPEPQPLPSQPIGVSSASGGADAGSAVAHSTP
jgi:hypothetical protein